MLRRANEPSSLTGKFSGGIGTFSIDTRKAFTGNIQRQLELLVNGVRVAEFLPAFPDGGSDVVLKWTIVDINVAGDIELTIRLFGADGNQQVTLDNLAWTGFEGTPTDIEKGFGLPEDFRLSQNYPNPFNPTTRIEFEMPVSGIVTLAVYDLLGRQVALLANENYSAGTHNIAFDASQLASGVYMYRLNVAGQTFTRKMTLVK